MNSNAHRKQVKILQWGTWRTMSTTFMRCMMGAEDSITFCEPMGFPWYYGTEARTRRKLEIPADLPEDGSTFELVKKKYEAPYEGKRLVFGKEMAYYVYPEEHLKQIPDGYRHSFLIRHPFKTMTSMLKVMSNQEDPGFKTIQPEEGRFEHIWKLYQHVIEQIDPQAIIIDADDFIRDAEAILRKYCSHYGLEFCDSMLDWEGDNFNEEIECWGTVWFGDLMSTKTIRKDPDVTDMLAEPPDMSHFSEDIRKIVEEDLIYYKKLHELRLQLKL